MTLQREDSAALAAFETELGGVPATSFRRLVPTVRELGAGDEAEAIWARSVDAANTAAAQQVASQPPPPRLSLGWVMASIRPSVVVAGEKKLPLILLGYFFFIFGLEGHAFGLLLPDIKKDLGLSTSLVVFYGSLVTYVGMGLAPLVGFISDRVKRVRMLAIGAIMSHAGMGLTGLSGSVGQMLLFRTFTGVGDSIKGPTGFPLMTDYYPPETRGRVFGFVQFAQTSGTILGPLVGALVGSAFGWRGTLMGLGFASAIVSLSFFLLKEPIRGQKDRIAVGLSEEDASKEQRPLGFAEGWRAAWSIRTVRRFCIGLPFVTVMAYQLPLFTNLYYVDRYHASLFTRGVIGSIAGLPAVFAILVGGALTDRFLGDKPEKLMRYGGGIMVLNAVGLLILVESPNIWIATAFNMIPAVLGSLLAPAQTTVMSRVLPARMRGFGLTVPSVFTLIGLGIGSLLGGLADSVGLRPALLIIIALQLIAAGIIGTSGPLVAADIRTNEAASRAERTARESASGETGTLLVCRDVDVHYDAAQILYGVDLDIGPGEFVALLGTNGAGKSTLLRAIAGVHPASGGAIFFEGDEITHLPPEQIATRGIVSMPGGHAVFPTMTVARNLRVAAWTTRQDEDHVREKTEEVLTRFPRLRERLHTEAGNLSGGEQQMLAIGQALLMKPKLLLIDELSLGLSPQVVQELLETLREINRAGTAVVIVEQSINVALQVAERAVFMEKGQVRFDGPVRDLMSQPGIVRSVFLAGAVTSSGLARPRLSEVVDGDIEEALELKDVTLSYGGLQVLRGVSLTVAPGEVVGIVGANGAGKTTLFDVITGFATPASGTVALAGRDVTKLGPDARARLGLARSYQSVRLFPALTVRENIAVALERHLTSRSVVLAAVWSPITRRSERKVTRRVDNLVESLGLGPFADKFMDELSTGTRRIADIACLLAAQPSVLLLDEPSSGLAQAETEMLGPVISRIVKETGCAALIIEHDLGLVASASDRMVAMELGQVLTEGAPSDVLADPAVVSSLLGGATEATISRSIALNTTATGSRA